MKITKEEFCKGTGLSESCTLFEFDNGKWTFDLTENVYTFSNGRYDYKYQIRNGILCAYLDWLDVWRPVGDEMMKEVITEAFSAT